MSSPATHEQAQEELGRDPKKIRLNNDDGDFSSNTAAAAAAADTTTTVKVGKSSVQRYKNPTEQERREVMELLSQTNGFYRLFRPNKQSKIGRECHELYTDIPEGDKWWKDDTDLLLNIRYHPPDDALSFVSDRLQLDKDFIIDLLSKRLWNTPDSHIAPSPEYLRMLQHCNSSVVDDDDFLRRALRIPQNHFKRRFKHRYDRYEMYESGRSRSLILKYASPRLKDDDEFVTEICNGYSEVLGFASDRLKDDADFILSLIKPYNNFLEYTSKRLRDDAEFMLRAQEKIGKENCVAKLASERLRSHRDFMLDVQKKIAKDTSVLLFVSEQLLGDGEFLVRVWSITGREGVDFNRINTKLRDDKAFILRSIDVTKSFTNLGKFSSRLREDEDVVRKCLKMWEGQRLHLLSSGNFLPKKVKPIIISSPLEFANGSVLDSAEIVMLSIKYDPASLQYASLRLRSDEDLVTFALKRWRDSIEAHRLPFKTWNELWAGVASPLKDNRQFVSKALRFCPYFLSHTHCSRFGLEGELNVELENVRLVGIALGGTTGNTDHPTEDFWTVFYGLPFHHNRLLDFWKNNSTCNLVHGYLRRQETALTKLGGTGDSLMPIFNRIDSTNRRFDGFIDDKFNMSDWKSRKWERLWLIDRAGISFCKTCSSHNWKLPTDVLRCIAGFAGIDGIIKKTGQIEKYACLLNVLLRRCIVVPWKSRDRDDIFEQFGLEKYRRNKSCIIDEEDSSDSEDESSQDSDQSDDREIDVEPWELSGS